jgi:hypothetical protein
MYSLVRASAGCASSPRRRWSALLRGEELDFNDDQVFLYDGIPLTGT